MTSGRLFDSRPPHSAYRLSSFHPSMPERGERLNVFTAKKSQSYPQVGSGTARRGWSRPSFFITSTYQLRSFTNTPLSHTRDLESEDMQLGCFAYAVLTVM